MGKVLRRITGELALQETTRQELEHAVAQFVEESNQYAVPIDEDGFYNQLSREIVARGLRGEGGDLWLALNDGKVAAFALSHFNIEVDDKHSMVITCAYVAHGYRDGEHFKGWYKTLEDYAKEKGAKHIILPSSRSNKAYMRRLPGYHPYVVLLKKDL